MLGHNPAANAQQNWKAACSQARIKYLGEHSPDYLGRCSAGWGWNEKRGRLKPSWCEIFTKSSSSKELPGWPTTAQKRRGKQARIELAMDWVEGEKERKKKGKRYNSELFSSFSSCPTWLLKMINTPGNRLSSLKTLVLFLCRKGSNWSHWNCKQ